MAGDTLGPIGAPGIEGTEVRPLRLRATSPGIAHPLGVRLPLSAFVGAPTCGSLGVNTRIARPMYADRSAGLEDEAGVSVKHVLGVRVERAA